MYLLNLTFLLFTLIIVYQLFFIFTALQLAARTLERAFSRYQEGASDVSVFKLLGTVSRAAGEPRLLLLRIFELMDRNMDGRISNEGKNTTIN